MKVSEFIQELQQYPQDAVITFSFGEDEEDKFAVALAITDEDAECYGEACACLDNMEMDGIMACKNYRDDVNLLKVILKQDYFTDECFSQKIREANKHLDIIRR